MGKEFFLYLLSGCKQFLARINPQTTVRPAQDIEVVFNMANLLAFEPETGESIPS